MPLAALGQVAAPLIAARAVPVPNAPFQLVRRQAGAGGVLADADATSTVPAAPAASDGIISDPAATVDTAGAWTPGAGEISSLSSAAAAGAIPPAILSDPAVQKAISSVAVQQGYDPSVLMGSASSVLESGASNSAASASSDALTPTETKKAKTTSAAEASASDTDSILGAGAKSTAGMRNSTLADGADAKNGTDSSFAMPRINPKFGWVAVLSLGAGYLAVEGGL